MHWTLFHVDKLVRVLTPKTDTRGPTRDSGLGQKAGGGQLSTHVHPCHPHVAASHLQLPALGHQVTEPVPFVCCWFGFFFSPFHSSWLIIRGDPSLMRNDCFIFNKEEMDYDFQKSQEDTRPHRFSAYQKHRFATFKDLPLKVLGVGGQRAYRSLT